MLKEYNEIRWLHISDLHIGNPDSLWLDPTLRDRLKGLLRIIGSIDFVLITGDVIHQGKYQDRDMVQQAEKLISEIKKFCPHIIFCIGNHDYVRDDARFTLLKDWEQKSLDEKIKQQENYASKLRPDFEKFEKFCKGVAGQDNSITTKSYIYDKVSGINIVVLNTSTFAGQPVLDEKGNIIKNDGIVEVNDQGKMWMCVHDFPDVSNLDSRNPTIVIGHHPLQMFEKYSREKTLEFLKNLPAKYYFCGHIHKKEDREIEGITQLASAGLFKDGYNIPTVTLYQIKKNQNEHIDIVDIYSFSDGEWNKNTNKDSGAKNERNQSELYQKEKETDVDDTKGQIVFPVTDTSISDGAVRIPYNGGIFNLYLSKSAGMDMVVPHMHKDMDEVTYVVKGNIYGYIGKQYIEASAGAVILMPKGEFHSFIPNEYPCELITMGVETGNYRKYEAQWNEEIEQIERLNQELADGEGEKAGAIYDELVKYLESTILEVRWKAIDVLKKHRSREDEDGYIEAIVKRIVIESLKSSNTERKLFGINMAYEFRISIVAKVIHSLMTDLNHFMYVWNCAYYLIGVRPNIDYDNLYNKLLELDSKELSEHQKISLYYDKIIIVLMQLIIKHNSRHFDAVYEQEKNRLQSGVIPIDDIIIHFVLWYTSFNKLGGDVLNYEEAVRQLPEIEGLKKDDILRGMLSFNNSEERFKVLKACKEKGVLAEIVKAYFGSMRIEQENKPEENSTKENVKKYLRIIISEKCNLNCLYCHHEGRIDSLIGSSIKSNPEFKLEEFLEQARKNGFSKIKISGGEPLLYPNIIEICNKFQKDFEDIGFTTNGTQITRLKSELDKIKGSSLSFNVTLNTCNSEKYKVITGGGECLEDVKAGIEYLVSNKFQVKLNSVITKYNIEDIEHLVAYAARLKINIKFLDLFPVGKLPNEFQHVSIVEIKNRLKQLYGVNDDDFYLQKDYLCMKAMGIEIMIPKRIYSSDCIYNCEMYPCAEGIFGMRVYEDYSCARCFNGEVFGGGLEKFSENVDKIRRELDLMKFSF